MGTKKKIKAKIPFVSKLANINSIDERNKAFDELSDEDKRREIALDGLSLVMTNLIYPARGYYWDSALKYQRTCSSDSAEFQRRLLKQDNIEGCTVCQRGLIMLATIRVGNNINPRTYDIASGTASIVRGFTMLSMERMEREYESGNYGHPFMSRSRQKLMNICCNIVKNGDFNRDDKTDYLSLWNIPHEKEVLQEN